MTGLPPLDLTDPVHQAGAAGLGLMALLILLLILATLRAGRAARTAAALSERVDRIGAAQSELSGAQSHAAHRLDSRLDALTTDMGATLTQSADRTAHSLGALQERLAAIDRAQANIEKLSEDVLSLQDILSNKQSRGAFGEIQLHGLLQNALPPDAWRWQVTLANGTRADCVIDLPDPPGPIVIDAKFPLEAFEALQVAETQDQRKAAERAFRAAIRAHIKVISTKYLAPGETADNAVMFLPSEAVFAEMHANFADVVREGFHARVWTVSPTTCMALLNTLRAVLKDTRLRKEAAAIRDHLRLLQSDLAQLGSRAAKLQAHFTQVQSDIDGVGVAAGRAVKRAERLETLDFGDADGDPPPRSVRILRP